MTFGQKGIRLVTIFHSFCMQDCKYSFAVWSDSMPSSAFLLVSPGAFLDWRSGVILMACFSSFHLYQTGGIEICCGYLESCTAQLRVTCTRSGVDSIYVINYDSRRIIMYSGQYPNLKCLVTRTPMACENRSLSVLPTVLWDVSWVSNVRPGPWGVSGGQYPCISSATLSILTGSCDLYEQLWWLICLFG